MIANVSQMVKKEVGGRWAGPGGEGHGRVSDTHPPGAARRRLLERAVSVVSYIWKGAGPTNYFLISRTGAFHKQRKILFIRHRMLTQLPYRIKP